MKIKKNQVTGKKIVLEIEEIEVSDPIEIILKFNSYFQGNKYTRTVRIIKPDTKDKSISSKLFVQPDEKLVQSMNNKGHEWFYVNNKG